MDALHNSPAKGQVVLLMSTNNFIKKVPENPITNGHQIAAGLCNPTPMGTMIAATTKMPMSKFVFPTTTKMPVSKFVFPTNNATVRAQQTFTICMAVQHLEMGNFVNAATNYIAAPQQVNVHSDIQGHSHVVIEALPSLASTAVTDPSMFAFFKGLNDKAQGGRQGHGRPPRRGLPRCLGQHGCKPPA